jgi:hypothetical protein
VKAAPFRFTVARYRILRTAALHERGLVSRPYLTGFEAVSWDRNASALCKQGWLEPYVHGGFEITAAGRTAASGDAP